LYVNRQENGGRATPGAAFRQRFAAPLSKSDV
jgi:hypothetical protein